MIATINPDHDNGAVPVYTINGELHTTDEAAAILEPSGWSRTLNDDGDTVGFHVDLDQ